MRKILAYYVYCKGKQKMTRKSMMWIAAGITINICHVVGAMDEAPKKPTTLKYETRTDILDNWYDYQQRIDPEVRKRHNLGLWHQQLHRAVTNGEISSIELLLKKAGKDASELVSKEYSVYGTIIERVCSGKDKENIVQLLLPYMQLDVLKACFAKRLIMAGDTWQKREHYYSHLETSDPSAWRTSAIDYHSENILFCLHKYNPEQFPLNAYQRKHLNIAE